MHNGRTGNDNVEFPPSTCASNPRPTGLSEEKTDETIHKSLSSASAYSIVLSNSVCGQSACKGARRRKNHCCHCEWRRNLSGGGDGPSGSIAC